MTPRGAGWLTGAGVFATMAALHVAVALTGNATDAGEATGGLVLSVALAAAAGVLVAFVAASMRGRRAAVIAAVSSYVVVGVWMWWRAADSPRTPEEDPARYALELVAASLTVGTAFALAAAVLAWWVARNAVGQDGPERVLALETASLQGSRGQWGSAMRAELASIDDPVQRSRFARGAGIVAVRHGTGRWPAILAALAGVGAAVVVFSAARISFDRAGDRGLLGEPLMGLVFGLLVVAVIAGTLIGSSFRAGLETAVLAWLAVYVCSVAVEIPQALAWYHDGGILLFDGEPAAHAGVDELGAALQPITHFGFIFMSVSQLVIAVLAAAVGAMVLSVVRVSEP